MPPTTQPADHRRINFAYSILIICATAFGYWVLGANAGFFAIPPGYASPIWPAAGLALLMILRFGYAAAIGVFWGSFLTNLGISGDSLLEPSWSWLSAGWIAVGAALQTVVARLLIKSFTHYPQLAKGPYDSIVFGLLGAPLACLISASFGISSLVYNGIIPTDLAPISWINWWIGDSIGVLLFAPLLLSMSLGEASNSQATIASRTVIFSSIYLLLIGITITLFIEVRADQTNKVEALFNEKVDAVHQRILRQLDSALHSTQTLAAVFKAFDDVSYEQFSLYANQIIPYTAGTHALSWIPIVEHKDRETYERGLPNDIVTPQQFWEINESGQQIRRQNHDRYFPVYYIQPLEHNQAVIGFDLGSNEYRLRAINLSLNSKKATATRPITLVQEQENQRAFLILTPVIKSNDQTIGLISTVYRSGDLINVALADTDARFISLAISDVFNNQQEQFYQSSDDGQYFEKNIITNHFQRQWKFDYKATDEFIKKNQSLNIWAVLIGGFLLVSIFGMFLLSIISRNAVVEHEVQTKTQALNQALEKAEHATRVKSDFLAGMSHELRTPLNSIIGFSIRLIKTLDNSIDQRTMETLKIIERNGKHLLTLINDILDLSKVEAGKLVVQKEKQPIDEILQRLSEMVLPMLEGKSIDFTIHPTTVNYIYADPKRLLQVLINLCSNAIKFTQKGKVSVQVLQDVRHEKAGVTITVTDTGSGIKPENLHKLFRRYEQLGESEKTSEMGTGLGLALTQELVNLHNGESNVESEYGKGSTFSVWFPDQ